MIDRQLINDFVKQKSLAIVGVKRNGQGFGNSIRKELSAKGFTLYPVHPAASEIAGQACAGRLSEVAAKVGGLIIVTPPSSTEKLVKEAAAAGFKRIWIQQGAQSAEAVRFCEQNGISVIHDQCILMFAEPAGFPHNFHRWLLKVFKRLPR